MIHIDMHAHPTDETCGATCLHAVYRYYGLNIPLDDVISGVDRSRFRWDTLLFVGQACLVRRV